MLLPVPDDQRVEFAEKADVAGEGGQKQSAEIPVPFAAIDPSKPGQQATCVRVDYKARLPRGVNKDRVRRLLPNPEQTEQLLTRTPGSDLLCAARSGTP